MEYDEVMQELKNMGDQRAVEVWKCLKPDINYLGVSLRKLERLARKIKKDHELARKLWDSKILDAQFLATMIEDVDKVTEQQIDEWLNDINFMYLSDLFASNIVLNTPYVNKKIQEWTKAKEERIKRTGFILVTKLAEKDKMVSDSEFENYLKQIEGEIHNERNWVQEAMYFALFAIGSRNEKLKEISASTAKKIGKVNIDYGEMSGKNPDTN